jgi:hypothetical protein
MKGIVQRKMPADGVHVECREYVLSELQWHDGQSNGVRRVCYWLVEHYPLIFPF